MPEKESRSHTAFYDRRPNQLIAFNKFSSSVYLKVKFLEFFEVFSRVNANRIVMYNLNYV